MTHDNDYYTQGRYKKAVTPPDEELGKINEFLAKETSMEREVIYKPGSVVYKEPDPVNHPSHYNKDGIECIQAIKASMSDEEFQGYLKGNAMKYQWRYKYKGKPVEDLKKAQWYLNKLIEEMSDD